MHNQSWNVKTWINIRKIPWNANRTAAFAWDTLFHGTVARQPMHRYVVSSPLWDQVLPTSPVLCFCSQMGVPFFPFKPCHGLTLRDRWCLSGFYKHSSKVISAPQKDVSSVCKSLALKNGSSLNPEWYVYDKILPIFSLFLGFFRIFFNTQNPQETIHTFLFCLVLLKSRHCLFLRISEKAAMNKSKKWTYRLKKTQCLYSVSLSNFRIAECCWCKVYHMISGVFSQSALSRAFPFRWAKVQFLVCKQAQPILVSAERPKPFHRHIHFSFV